MGLSCGSPEWVYFEQVLQSGMIIPLFPHSYPSLKCPRCGHLQIEGKRLVDPKYAPGLPVRIEREILDEEGLRKWNRWIGNPPGSVDFVQYEIGRVECP